MVWGFVGFLADYAVLLGMLLFERLKDCQCGFGDC
jgi:hypothetical protein